MLKSGSKCKTLIALAVLLVFSARAGGDESSNSDIRVEFANQELLILRVSLRSRAETPVTIHKELLPWGNVNSLKFEAVTADRHFVTRIYPIDDPGFEQVTLKPNEWISGEVDLHFYFKDLDDALRKSDIHLLWACKAPDELRIASRSHGQLLIPHRK